MPESAKKLLDELTAVGLLSSDQATKFDVEIQTGIEALLERLIRDKVITEYQAEKFRDGKVSDIVFGEYVVVDKIGQGGMGTVLLAEHRRMERQVAIKILPVTSLDSEAAVARFYQELKVAAQLTHPNIVHAYDASEHHGFHYLVMEYVPGHDLARVLEMLGPIPPGLAVDYILQAAHGLEYAHRKGVVHRDIKPSNLLLDNEGNIKVLDLGLARIGGRGIGDASMHLTTTGQVMGTVDYMSPEQAEDTRQADPRSDIYSLGCTLYRLISGLGPFSRETVVKTILAHRDAEIPSLASISTELDDVFKKMVAKNPDDRFQSSLALIEGLRKISGTLPDNFLPSDVSPSMASESATMMPMGSSAVSAHEQTIDRPSTTPANQDATGADALNVSYMNYVPPGTPSSQSEINSHLHPSGIPKGFVSPPNQVRLMKHHRAKKMLVFAVLSLMLSFCWLFVVTDIIVWVYANSDLEEMKQRHRDPAGTNLTKTARIVSQIGIGIASISFIRTMIW